MTWKIIVIPCNDAQPMRVEEIPQTLEALQDLVGGYIEHVRIGNHLTTPPTAFEDLVMYVDDEGLIKRKPMNARASVLYGTLQHGQPICGDAILTGEAEIDPMEGRDIVDVPDWATLEFLTDHLKEVITSP